MSIPNLKEDCSTAAGSARLRFRTGRALLLGLLGLGLFLPGGRSGAAPLVSLPHYDHPGGGQVFYFVLTDRFANGDSSNDTGGLGGGPAQNGFDPTAINYYHGGDFKGLTQRLDYIMRLGTTAIWITPPFKNKPVQAGSAGYHGYWILDFMHIDPHLGSDADFREFVAQAHARGIKVYLDIVVNHTADVIKYKDGGREYRDRAHYPYRDASGRPFDEHALAYNGVNSPGEFPQLSAERSFAHVPVVNPLEAHAKGPDWLNDVTLYHNRGDSRFFGENSLHGDFGGLDDVFTETPRVVLGFIEVYRHWIEDYGIDGYRIDTVKHVNLEFWQAFAPALHDAARKMGRPDFFMFGEVANSTGDSAFLSTFSRTGLLDAPLDFGFYAASREFVSRGKDASVLARLFDKDDLFTGPDRNANMLPTFISNHDDGRFGYFLRRDNPTASEDRLLKLEELGYGLLYLSRGQPVLYYGDEQGMCGTGNDNLAREDMFASRAPAFRKMTLLGTNRSGADDKFDESHQIYNLVKSLAALRANHPAFERGSMIIRQTKLPEVFAFSRVLREECVEYLVALNNSKVASAQATIQTSQPSGAVLRRIFDSRNPNEPGSRDLAADAKGQVLLTLEPLQFGVWRAASKLAAPTHAVSVSIATPLNDATLAFATREIDGHTIPIRQEIRAEVTGGDGVAEVTFVMTRASRPGQYELLGTDDAPPYRVFWQPPADLALGEILTFIATVDDLRGHRASAEATNVAVAPNRIEFGIQGAQVPRFTKLPEPTATVGRGKALHLEVQATGTLPLDYQWFQNNIALAGATSPALDEPQSAASPGDRFFVTVRNREGTVMSGDTVLVPATP